jgi:hypothetical protein
VLKFQLDQIDDLDDSLKPLYEEKDGKFVLKVDGVPQQKDEGLAERLKKLEDNNRELLAEKKRAQEAAEKAALDAAKKGGDVEALEKSWNDKLTQKETELKKQIEERDAMISGLTVGSAAASLAAEIFGEHADLMMHHVTQRLTYEISDGKPRVRVLEDGKPSAKSLDDLKEEFKTSQKFAPFVVGSKATGPGGHGKPGGAKAGKKFTDYSGAELVDIRRNNPGEYQRLVEEHRRTT